MFGSNIQAFLLVCAVCFLFRGGFSQTNTLSVGSLGSAQWSLDGDSIRFEFETSGDWIALGVSADQQMGGDGIDDVLACQADGNGDVFAKDTYNPVVQSPRDNIIDSSQDGLVQISASITDRRLRCVFTREIAALDDSEDRNLNQSAFLLLAVGNGRAAETDALTPPHSMRIFTEMRIDLTEVSQVTTSCADDVLTRMHGALMFISWGFLVPIAIFFAENMRPALVKGVWFQLHRALMLIAMIPSIIGFIFIFIAHRNTAGRIALGSDNPIGTSHFVFGIIIIILQVLNPIIAICRCKPKSKNRWIFDLIHGVCIGHFLSLLTAVNMGFGFSRLVNTRLGGMDAVLWLYVAVICAFGLVEIVSAVIFKSIYYYNKNKEKQNSGDTVKATSEGGEMSAVAMKDDKEDKPEPKPSKDSWLRWLLFSIGAGILILGGIPIIVLIFIGASC